MLFKILKKDMKRRKGVNLILFLFIALATVFLASSVSNILVVSSAVEYYLDYANIPDVYIMTKGMEEQEQITKWITDRKEDVTAFDVSTFLSVSGKDVKVVKDGVNVDYTTKGESLFLDTADTSYCKVFDEDGNKIKLQPGEIAMVKSAMDRNDIQVGDQLQIQYGGLKQVFTVRLSVKDAAYGNDMVGMNRFVISEQDFSEFSKEVQGDTVGMYYLSTDNGTEVGREFDKQGFTTASNTVMRDTYLLVYSFDMIIAGILIAIGVCLILIALLVLRFTLVFTLEEDYREIGIMKAVGLRDFAIKRIYLIKYLAIVIAGSALGLLISFPVSRRMIKSVATNMIMQDGSENSMANIVCALVIILLVMAFCYNCTRKLNKISAVSAIRNGQTGERFKKRSGISLHRRTRMPVVCFLGMNDVRSNLKRYLVLLITFCISFVLITIPLNTVTTMQNGEMASKFTLDPKGSVYIKRIEKDGEGVYSTRTQLQTGMNRVKEELKEKGYEAELASAIMYFMKYRETSKDDVENLLTIQLTGAEGDFRDYSKGAAPVLSNEIALSESVLEENQWEVGDTIQVTLGGKNQNFIITGTYSDYMQLGKSARMNPNIDLTGENMMDYSNIMVYLETDKTQEELAKELNKKMPAYEWVDAKTIVNSTVGGIEDTLGNMLIPMTGMLCLIVMLITVLMGKLFVTREKGEIAMMKSIGFSNRHIRNWQVLRMVCVVLTSMVLAVPLSLISNQFILRPIFKIMGADITIQVIPWKVYGAYPGILLLGIIAATVIASAGIRKINIREQNNLE